MNTTKSAPANGRAYDAIVIGAGHNGLTAAAMLGKRGLRVLVLERSDRIGGAAVTVEIAPGFRCDIGAHRLGGLHRSVARGLNLGRYGMEVVRPECAVYAPDPDGGALHLWRDPRRSLPSIRERSSADADRWIGFDRLMFRLAGLLEVAYTAPPPNLPRPSRSDLLTGLELALRLRRVGRRRMAEAMRALPMSAADLLDEWFEDDLLKGTLAASGITGVFHGPMAAGTGLLMAHHHVGVDRKTGLRSPTFVRAGIGMVAGALAGVAIEHGVEIRTEAEVERIRVRDGRVAGVALDTGEEIEAARVLSSADPRRTFLELLDPAVLGAGFLQRVRKIRFRGIVAKVHLALGDLPAFRGAPEGDAHLRGVISISPSVRYLERACDDAKYGAISDRPYLEAVIPSLHSPELAPRGRHVMSVLVQYAPYHLKDGTWDAARREELADRVIETLAEYAPNLPSVVVHRHVLTSLDLETRFALTEGNIYQGEMTLDQLFVMRPVPGWSRYRTPIEGLYLCGAGAHPGGGLSGYPGANAARDLPGRGEDDRSP